MKTCIAYFSKEGNTKAAAEYMAKKFGADLICLRDVKGYRGFFGFMKGGFLSATGRSEKLDPEIYTEISRYQRVILADPVWAGKTTPMINAVLKNVELNGKEMILVTVQADPQFGGHSEREARYRQVIAGKGGTFMGCYPLLGNGPGKAPKSRAEMAAQVDEKVAIK